MSKLKLFAENKTIYEDLKVDCPKCGSTNTDLVIDWAAYPEASWLYVRVECKEWECKTTTIHPTKGE